MENTEAIFEEFSVNEALALCHIIDEFPEFEKNLLPYIKTNKSNRQVINRQFINNLFEISTGNHKIGCKKEHEFYQKNKKVVDTINNYMNIDYFILHLYDCGGDKIYYSLYDHILENKKDIDKILNVLEKLKELGFEYFAFGAGDFTKEKICVQLYEEGDVSFSYIANMKIISSIDPYIEYTTDDSNYVISLDTDTKRTSIHSKYIYLNSLTFDSSALPEKIDIEHTLGHILSLEEEFAKDASNVSLDDVTSKIVSLDNYVNDLIETINGLDDDVNKDVLLEYTKEIKSSILNAHYASRSIALKRTKK